MTSQQSLNNMTVQWEILNIHKFYFLIDTYKKTLNKKNEYALYYAAFSKQDKQFIINLN